MSHNHSIPIYINNIADTAVLESPIHGFGLFATNDIQKGTLLCRLNGQIITHSQYKKIYKSRIFPKETFIEKHLLNNNMLMITPFRTSYSFINHSDTIEHLVEKQKWGRIEVYAATDIPKNTEILSKYNLNNHIDVLGGFKV